jgi:hypothetical protein
VPAHPKRILCSLIRLGLLAIKNAEAAEAGIGVRALERAAHEVKLPTACWINPESGTRTSYSQAPGSPSEGGELAE